MSQPTQPPVEGYVNITVTFDDGKTLTFNEVGGTKVVPSTPPVLLMNDREGHMKAMLPISAGMVLNFESIIQPNLVLATRH